MGLGAENRAIFEQAVARGRALVAADAGLRAAQPALELVQSVMGCRTSIEIVQRLMEVYADRPALGYRRRELAVNAATGRREARALPAFETLSYRALWERIARCAGGLVHGGLARTGELVALVGFSTVDHVVAELACHYVAAVSVPLGTQVAAGELEAIVRECACAVVCCSVEELPLAVRVLPACPSVRALVVIDGVDGDDAHAALVGAARASLAASRPDVAIATIAEVEARGEREDRVPPVIPANGDDPLLSLVYTSGSTGTPKGAMMTERSWHARWSTLPFPELAALPMVSVVFLPQHHMGGRNAVANSLKLGGLACFTHERDMFSLFEDIRLVRPTYLHLVPRLSALIYQHYQSEVARRGGGAGMDAEVEAAVVAEMRAGFLGGRLLLALTASAPTPPEVSAFIRRCFEVPIVDVFAGTEYGQILVDGRVNRGNVLEEKLVDVPELGYLATDEPYPRGELYVKTARGIASYFKNEAATRALLDPDGFMRTGDIFERRGPDELAWIDRKNNVQKLAQGEFVNLWRLEALLASGSRFVKQVYLQGDSARAYLLAVVVPEAAELAARGEAAVRALLREELQRLAVTHGLAPYEIPRDFLVELEPFSRENGLLTSLGKPARPQLKAKYGPAIDRLYEQLERRASAPAALLTDSSLPVAARVRGTIAALLGLAEADLDASRPFRSFGGDSIAAANLCAAVQRSLGVRLSVSRVLGPETAINDLCREVEARAAEGGGAAEAEGVGEAGKSIAVDGAAHLERGQAVSVASSHFERIHGASPDAIRAADLRLAYFFDEGAAPHLTPAEGSGAHLNAADVSAAHLTPAEGAGAHLNAADVSAAHLGWAEGVGTHLTSSEGVGPRMTSAEGAGARLNSADVSAAHLGSAEGAEAHLNSADVSAAHLGWAEGAGAHLNSADILTRGEGTSTVLTGATGFLGRFLCLALLERAVSAGGRVYCLVRARSDEDAARRLAAVYRPGSALHERFTALARGRLHVLAGDLEQPRLGLAEATYRRLADDTTAIIHAAALVNHALPYAALFDANVLATARVLGLALTSRPKRVAYISTNSVSLALLGDRPLALETDDTRALGDGWPATAARHANGYQLSKWAGEVLAQDLAETHGVPVAVFRCNLILPPAGTRAQANPDDFLSRLAASVVATGAAPRSFYAPSAASPPHLDGFPADFTAAAIAAIAAASPPGYAVYHVNNIHWDDGLSLDTLMDRLAAAGYPLDRIADHSTWFARFEHSLRALPATQQAASSLPILDQWRTPLSMTRRRRIDAARFRAQVQALRPLGFSDLPHLDAAYLDRCIEDLHALGLLPTPALPAR